MAEITNEMLRYRMCMGPFKYYVTPWGWGGGGQLSRKKGKVYGSMLLALRGGVRGSNSLEKSVT